eukprot:Hpha_TRINITY_DN26444_c0_g1::TRINITY_DN26444_c0_g1_i1::g.33868::m.33868
MAHVDPHASPERRPSVLSRDLQRASDYTTTESFTVDTRDHKDHTFCGVMFDVAAHAVLPVQFIEISALWVRGQLGHMTVWWVPNGHAELEEAPEAWNLVHEQEHEPSPDELVALPLTPPLRLAPGSRAGLYVHCARPGDQGLVYDDARGEVTYEDRLIRVETGQGHLSCRPFGRKPPWAGGWGGAWRPGREFVGKVSYGVRYKLWTPQIHHQFPPLFRATARAVLKARWRFAQQCAEDEETVPVEWLLYILNFCRWDTAGDGRLPFRARPCRGAVRCNLSGVLGRSRSPAFFAAVAEQAARGLCADIGAGEVMIDVQCIPDQGLVDIAFSMRGAAECFVRAFSSHPCVPQLLSVDDTPVEDVGWRDEPAGMPIGTLVVGKNRRDQPEALRRLLPPGHIGRVTGHDGVGDPIVKAPRGRKAAVSKELLVPIAR